MKKEYDSLVIELIKIEHEDILTASDEGTSEDIFESGSSSGDPFDDLFGNLIG